MTPSGVSLSYDQGIAVGCKSVIAAIIYNNICYWIKHNILSDQNLIDGRTWSYQSIPYMAEYFPEFTDKQIRDALDVLVEKGLLIKGHHSKNKFDRTNWYALPDESILKLERFSKKLFDTPHRADAEDLQGRCNKHVTTNIHILPKVSICEPPKKEEKLMKSFHSPNLTKEHIAKGKGEVKMTLEQWDKLRTTYPGKIFLEVATEFSEALAQEPLRYKKRDHYLTIGAWIRKELKKKPSYAKVEKRDFRDFPGNYTMERPVETETY